VAESPDGETPVIVGMADAAMHMYGAAIEALPDSGHPEYPERAAVVLTGLRKLQKSLADAASRSRATPSVIVALSGVRSSYDKLMADAAAGPYATLGQRLFVARQHARLSPLEAANAVGLRADLIESVEAGEQATKSEEARITELLVGLEGGSRPVEPAVVKAPARSRTPVTTETVVEEAAVEEPTVSAHDEEPEHAEDPEAVNDDADADFEPVEVRA
jgi:hypothetical protein